MYLHSQTDLATDEHFKNPLCCSVSGEIGDWKNHFTVVWMKISMQSLEKKWRIPISKCNLSDSWFWKSSQSTFILQRIPNTYISINKNTFYFFMVVLDFVYTFFNVAEILYMSLCYHWLMNVKRKKRNRCGKSPVCSCWVISEKFCPRMISLIEPYQEI